MAETKKAFSRRKAEKFFQKYCQGRGIDIGCGEDLITNGNKKSVLDVFGFDAVFGHGDATHISNQDDEKYDWVYSAHCLEHIADINTAVTNWWRILKPGGYLILYLPERDLYEKRKTLPSNWNGDHKHFFLLDFYEPPCTIGLVPWIGELISSLGDGTNYKILEARTLQPEPTPLDPMVHSQGEYSIELIIKKLK